MTLFSDRHNRNGLKAANQTAANIFKCLFAKPICFQCAFIAKEKGYSRIIQFQKAFFVAKCRVNATSYVDDLFQKGTNQATWGFKEDCCDIIQNNGCTTCTIPFSFFFIRWLRKQLLVNHS